nr:hypothetical protein [Tanacetum cinerariifolium]
MDPNSSLEKICLGEDDVIVISSEKVDGSGDWSSLEFQDTANSGKKKETMAMVFYQMETEEFSDRLVAPCSVNGLEAYNGEINLGVEKNIISNEYAVKLSGGHLTQEEVAKEALSIRMSQKFALLEEERLIIETMAYHDKYKKVVDEVWKDKVELDGNTVKEEEKEAVKRIKGEALKEKDNPGTFIFLIRLKGQLGREDTKKADRGIMMINHTQAEAMGILINVLCQVGVITFIAKKYATLQGSEPHLLHQNVTTMGTHEDEAGSSLSKCSKQYETVEEDVLNRMGCDGDIDDMLRINLREARSDKEMFTSFAWIRAFNINEPIYIELCHEFYLTYKFNEVYDDDELQTKKIIKFRLGGRARSLTLLEFARRLGLYQAVELNEEGFNVYFEGEDVLRSLSAPVYCKDLDTAILRELIDSESRLIPSDPQPGVHRVGISRPPRASMKDLYKRMGSMKIRHEAIERMEYR